MNIVLIGQHGVGKTTIGTRLARALGVPFHHELGRELAEDRSWRPEGMTAADAAVRFDQELFARELARDLQHRGGLRIVESWHPTNLAYASLRSPEVVAGWLPAIRRQMVHQPTMVLSLVAPGDVLAARQSEPGEQAFFREVGEAATRWCQDFGLPCLGTWSTHTHTPDELVATLVEQFQSVLPSLSPFTRSIPCV